VVVSLLQQTEWSCKGARWISCKNIGIVSLSNST